MVENTKLHLVSYEGAAVSETIHEKYSQGHSNLGTLTEIFIVK